jgi:hypothetical protein
MEISLEITFHPNELNQDVRYENIPCEIEGSALLHLTLTGMCIPQPAHTDILKFSSPVRSPDLKSVTLTNKTNSLWHIQPIIDCEVWTGPAILDIDVGQSKTYDLTFCALETNGTGEGGRHEGSIFFPLPDGTGILYKLIGNVDKPLVVDNITKEIPCKIPYSEILPVYNWLRRSQRFKVTAEFSKSDSGVLFKGHDFIDGILDLTKVPPLTSKDYKFTFFAYKDGITNFKVFFKNETSQEYLFYNINYKGLPAGIITSIEMNSAVRQLCTKELTIYNPLQTPVTFTGTSNNPELTAPSLLVIGGKSEGVCNFELLPLQAKESVTRVTLVSTDLGTYQYDIKTNVVPCGLERPLNFKTGLGGSQTQTFRFISYPKMKTDYTCKIDNAEFSVEKSVVAPPGYNSLISATANGVELSVDVTYEPSRFGDVRTQLIVSSLTGGDYICPLIGHCISPRPQGPIIIKAGAPSSVLFKNVFNTNATFSLLVDNPAFIVKPSETIPYKKTVPIMISFKTAVPPASTVADKNQKEKAAVPTNILANQSKTGKLTITNQNTNISWVYYLKYVPV